SVGAFSYGSWRRTHDPCGEVGVVYRGDRSGARDVDLDGARFPRGGRGVLGWRQVLCEGRLRVRSGDAGDDVAVGAVGAAAGRDLAGLAVGALDAVPGRGADHDVRGACVALRSGRAGKAG